MAHIQSNEVADVMPENADYRPRAGGVDPIVREMSIENPVRVISR